MYGQPAAPSTLTNVLTGAANFLNAIDGFFTNGSIDVMYKALAFCGGLFALYCIPSTRNFTGWAALCILLILMLQSQPTSTQQTPATSTLPLPTQINTPDPSQLPSGAGQQQQQQSNGGGLGGILGLVGTVASFF